MAARPDPQPEGCRLAVDGHQGAKRVLDLLHQDFELTMKLCGWTSIQDITEEMIFNRRR
jgi:isopentenyl diphosphate isomerase/L-lactate dehydrogenase-like FMN-dependent dehydrogenase